MLLILNVYLIVQVYIIVNVSMGMQEMERYVERIQILMVYLTEALAAPQGCV